MLSVDGWFHCRSWCRTFWVVTTGRTGVEFSSFGSLLLQSLRLRAPPSKYLMVTPRYWNPARLGQILVAMSFATLGLGCASTFNLIAKGKTLQYEKRLASGRDPNKEIKACDNGFLSTCPPYWDFRNCRSDNGLPSPTPLTAAAKLGQVEIVRMLLRHGADPNRRACYTHAIVGTPVTAALRGACDASRARTIPPDETAWQKAREIVAALLDAGATPSGTEETSQIARCDHSTEQTDDDKRAIMKMLADHGATVMLSQHFSRDDAIQAGILTDTRGTMDEAIAACALEVASEHAAEAFVGEALRDPTFQSVAAAGLVVALSDGELSEAGKAVFGALLLQHFTERYPEAEYSLIIAEFIGCIAQYEPT